MRLPSLKLRNFFLLGFFLCASFVFAQYKIPQRPAVLYPVYDEAQLLSDQEKQTLNQKLIKFEDSTSTEIEVIIIKTTGGEDVNYLATQFGEQWGIGKKNIDNGVVFLIATDDHTMSIQQGRAVEQYLTASTAGQILDYLVTPYFKQQQWYEGINHGTSAIIDALQGKFKPIPKKQPKEGGGVGQVILIIFIIIIIIYIMSRNNRGGGNGNDDDINLSRRGRSIFPGGFFPFPGSFGGGGSGGFGGGSGGGFGGFGGGGSFGGGGASGGW